MDTQDGQKNFLNNDNLDVTINAMERLLHAHNNLGEVQKDRLTLLRELRKEREKHEVTCRSLATRLNEINKLEIDLTSEKSNNKWRADRCDLLEEQLNRRQDEVKRLKVQVKNLKAKLANK